MKEVSANSTPERELNSRIPFHLSQEEVEQKILNRFTFLQKEGGIHQFYSSYDFRLEERNMVETWEKILEFLLSDIFHCFAITISDLKKYSIIKNNIPIGLNNIIQQFRIEQKYITDEDLKSEKFYQLNYPDLYSKPSGYISGFISGIQSFINFTGTKIGCKEDNDNNKSQIPIRTDISEEDKYQNIPENSIIFNFENFRTHCNQVLEVLKDILLDNDEEVIPKNHFIKAINERYTKEKGERLSLEYGTQYIDYVLYYLMKIKKIALFEIESNNKKIECIKLLKDQSDTITEKDKAISKILIHIELLEKRINEYQKKIENLRLQAIEQKKKGNIQAAKTYLIKKKNIEKFLETSQNSQTVLEKQIFDLKNAENNASVTEVLKQTLEATKEIKLEPDTFAEVVDDLKDQKDTINEVNTGMAEFIDKKEEEEINKEMENLLLENKPDIDLPNPNTEIIDENKVFENLVK